MFKRVLLCYDGTDAGRRAVRRGAELAILTRKLLNESIEWLKVRGVVAEGYLASGEYVDQIIEYSRKLNIDLIVLGHYPQPEGGFWWSGAQRVSLAERANCCIFVAVNSSDEPATSQR